MSAQLKRVYKVSNPVINHEVAAQGHYTIGKGCHGSNGKAFNVR